MPAFYSRHHCLYIGGTSLPNSSSLQKYHEIEFRGGSNVVKSQRAFIFLNIQAVNWIFNASINFSRDQHYNRSMKNVKTMDKVRRKSINLVS